jgi:hypothetical protein
LQDKPAGTTIPDERYWRSEAGSADQNAVKGPETAIDSMEMPRGIEVPGPSCHDGPRENYQATLYLQKAASSNAGIENIPETDTITTRHSA